MELIVINHLKGISYAASPMYDNTGVFDIRVWYATAFTQNTNLKPHTLTYQCKIILITVNASVYVIRLYCGLK